MTQKSKVVENFRAAVQDIPDGSTIAFGGFAMPGVPFNLIKALLEHGAKSVYAAATHGVFSGNAYENLASTPFERIVVTDTIPISPGAPDNVFVLPCAELLTDSIRRIFTDGSVSEVFGGENQLF